ncbi:MAG: CerR family C-terminal domain-containing protein [Sulfuricellaceae bacterium]
MSPAVLPTRSDGTQARLRLLRAALECFATHGFNKTSTRRIAQAAGVNLAAINYYFGSKAELYRAVYSQLCEIAAGANDGEPQGLPAAQAGLPTQLEAGVTLLSVLQIFFRVSLQPLKQSETIRLSMRLHFREMLEPSGMLQEHIERQIRPLHESLTALLCNQLGLAAPDDDVLRLSLTIQGLVVFHFVAQDVVMQLAPSLTATEEAIDTLAERLAIYALSMFEAERQRRAGKGQG